MADPKAPEPISAPVDTATIVERWMSAQLILERQYFQRLGRQAGRNLRLLSLLEMDALTQLSADGQTLAELANTLDASPAATKSVVDRLVRRRLVRRQRDQHGSWSVHRTEKADELIQVLLRTQSDILANLLGRMDRQLRDQVLGLMKDGALSLNATAQASSNVQSDHLP